MLETIKLFNNFTLICMSMFAVTACVVLTVIGILLFSLIVCNGRRHNKEIIAANKKYESLLSNINGGMIVAKHALTADETTIQYVSAGFTNMTGYTLEDIQKNNNGSYLDVIFIEDRKAVFDKYLQQLKNGNTYRMPYRIYKKDGSIVWVMDNGYIVKESNGLFNHSIITDITAVKVQEEELRLSENRFSIAINASSGTLFEVNLRQQKYTHFENSERIFGVSAEKLIADVNVFSNLPSNEYLEAVTNYFFYSDDRIIAMNAMKDLKKQSIASYDARLRRADNTYIWARIDLRLICNEDGEPEWLVGFMSDIDVVKKQAEQLKTQIQTDPMTGLFNKVAMATLTNKALSDSRNGQHALIVLDIDNFKGINDTLGHAFGDVVLIEVCTKLKTLFRKEDILGRMGGDEFAIFMKNVPDTSGALKKATELSAAFRQTYIGEKNDYKISCSMGVIMIENSNDSFDTLYRKADAALYQAKQNGKDKFILYQEEDSENYPIENKRTNDEELQNLQVSHNIEAHIFELLYEAKDFNVSINMAIAAIGQQYHVSRVAIFENSDDNQFTNNTYEWCNDGIPSVIEKLKNVKMTSNDESILDNFDSKGLLYCNDVNELKPYLKKILQDKKALSTLQLTIVNDGKIYGFIGFDDCTEHRIWTSEEIEKLSYISKLLSVFLFKKKIESAVLENLKTRIKILDVLPDYICVVNPNTHMIEYTNRKMKELIPTVQAGAFCFTMLRGGQVGACKTCLVERIKRGDTQNLQIISEDKSIHLDVNALSINWVNNQKMVLLYGTKRVL